MFKGSSMNTYFKSALVPMVALALSVPSIVNATNGYFLIGFGAKSRAMGGAGVAYSMDGMSAAFNPATMIDADTELDLGAELFNPPRAIQHNSALLGQTNERSTTDLFMIPSMGGTYKWKDDITLGFAFIGAGLQTEYQQRNAAGTPQVFNALNNQATSEAGVELYQMQMVPSIAYRLNKQHTVGASLVFGAQFFRAEGLQDFAVLGFTSSTDGSGLTNEGFSHSFGGGVRLGWLGKFMDEDLSIGVNYSSRVYMSEFERYTSLFAEQGDFDIPENYAIGFAYKVKPELTVMLDVQRIMYNDIASVGNPGPLASNPSNFFPLCPPNADGSPSDVSDCLLGGDKGLGFGWTNQTVFKLGVDWAYSEKINLRGGLNYGKSPIPEDQVLFNMLAPATPELHLTLGASYIFSEYYTLSVNYVHAFLNTIKGPTMFGPGGIVDGSNASIAMSQNTLGATLAIKF